jgi:PAS domain S-box-containing protein
MTEESQTKSESLYKGLYDHMTSGSAIYEVINDGSKGSDYIIKNFNRKSLEIEGKTLEGVLGKSLLDLRPNIDDYGLIPVMRKVWKTGKPACFPVKMYKDHKFSSYYENYIFRIPTGEVVTIYNDVTDQKNTEQRLIESRSQLKVLVDTIPDLIWLKDPDGIYLGCNPTFEGFFGAKEAAIVGNTDYDFVDRELGDFFRAHDRKAMGMKQPSINEEWLTFADDGYHGLFETIKTPMNTSDGRLVGVLGIARDITKRKKAEKALQESDRRYKSAQRMGKVGNWEFDLNTGSFWGSTEAKRIYGFDPEADHFTTDDVENCIPDRERVHQALLDLIENGTPYDVEFEIRPVSGPEKKFIRSIAEVIRDESGIPKKVAGVIQDITQNKLADQKLRSIIEDLQKALAEVKKLSGLLPICMHCKKIRDDKGYWKQMEEYLSKHSEAQFSHSICRECAEKYYPQMDIYDES